MAKADTVKAIKAANGTELNEVHYSGSELDQLLVHAQQGDAGRQAFDDLRTQLDGDGKPIRAAAQSSNTPGADAGESSTRKRTVTLGPKASEGTSYLHPTDKVTILGDPVKVSDDEWTQAKIRSQELEGV